LVAPGRLELQDDGATGRPFHDGQDLSEFLAGRWDQRAARPADGHQPVAGLGRGGGRRPAAGDTGDDDLAVSFVQLDADTAAALVQWHRRPGAGRLDVAVQHATAVGVGDGVAHDRERTEQLAERVGVEPASVAA
jgi:hypothetical protein